MICSPAKSIYDTGNYKNNTKSFLNPCAKLFVPDSNINCSYVLNRKSENILTSNEEPFSPRTNNFALESNQNVIYAPQAEVQSALYFSGLNDALITSHSESIDTSILTTLNPLATPFIRRRHKQKVSYNLEINALGMKNWKCSMFDFMAFILVLCSFIINKMININFPENNCENANSILRKIRVKNVDRIIIGTLNINSLAPKFEELKLIIGNYLDILVIQETKLDPSFPQGQFIISGYTRPYRLDRNRNGGGVVIYVREDIPSRELKQHNFTKNIEGLFVEVNFRKSKLLFFGTYHSTHNIYGLNNAVYLEQIGLVYSNYEKFLLAGDFNMEGGESSLNEFLFEYNAKNLVKENTCFKSTDNPSCIDLFLTNSYQSFQNTTTVTTGLSDFHKMVVTVMKTTFPKAKPKVIHYRTYKHFILKNFRMELKIRLQNENAENYTKFEEIFLEILEKHAPLKRKFIRANDKPYMSKLLRKAIMRRSELKNRYYRDRLPESERAFKKQRNYTTKLLKKEKKRYYSSINVNNYTDNKKFWNTIKPLFSNYNGGSKKK